MHTFERELGTEYKSNISGFKGINVSNAVHLNGCDRCYLQPKVSKDGKLPDGAWFDDSELVPTKKKKIPRKKNNTGGFSSTIK